MAALADHVFHVARAHVLTPKFNIASLIEHHAIAQAEHIDKPTKAHIVVLSWVKGMDCADNGKDRTIAELAQNIVEDADIVLQDIPKFRAIVHGNADELGAAGQQIFQLGVNRMVTLRIEGQFRLEINPHD